MNYSQHSRKISTQSRALGTAAHKGDIECTFASRVYTETMSARQPKEFPGDESSRLTFSLATQGI